MSVAVSIVPYHDTENSEPPPVTFQLNGDQVKLIVSGWPQPREIILERADFDTLARAAGYVREAPC